MIKATELRIGNLIYGVSDRIEKVSQIGLLAITTTLPKMESHIANHEIDFNPIPLTEEWLIKFGFENKVETGVCIAFRFGTNPITKDHLIELIKIHGDEHFFYKNGYFKIKSVHQLQNLYFALTGQELTITNP